MNRRSFFKGLLALPVVAALAPLLPKVAPGVFREEDFLAAYHGIPKWWGTGFVHHEDISELLIARLADDSPLDALRDVEGPVALRFRWIEDSDNVPCDA